MVRKFVILLAVSLLLFISAVSAEIMISQPKAAYSLGETLDLTVEVSDGGDILKTSLVCEGDSKLLLFKNLGPEETKLHIFQPLTKSFLGDTRGACHVSAEYKGETETGQEFKISEGISIILNIANLDYDAGDTILVSGEATKENQEKVNGFVEVSIEDSDVRLINNVQNGKFSVNFTLPENLGSGRYNIRARVYEKDSKGEITNEGEERAVIGVKQEAKKIEIAINQQTIPPGKELSFKVLLYDQANYEMLGDASVSLKDSQEKEVLKKLVKTNEEITFSLENNASAGYWKIEASSQGITATRLFSVEENEKASFEVINDTLIITNIGNVPYNKAVQIGIGSEVEIKELNLAVGEERRFRLSAPEGEYKITVTDGSTTFSESDIALTGGIIGALDIKSQLSIWKKYPIIWIFLIMVMGLFILMLVQRTIKKRTYAYPAKEGEFKKSKSSGGISLGGKGFLKNPILTGKKIEAEHSLVLGGEKQSSALICLKIKNPIGKDTEKRLESAFSEAYDYKAAPYKTGSYIFMIFSPLLTGTFKNYANAIKAAHSIERLLKDHNRKFKEKIDFGISVHAGELASTFDRKENKLKFTAIGNAIGKAKRLADLSSQKTVLSTEIHEKTLSEVKTEKHEQAGQEFFTIEKIADNQENQKFVKDFLKRMNDDEQKEKRAHQRQ